MIQAFVAYLTSEKNYSAHTVSAYERDLCALESFLLQEQQRDLVDWSAVGFEQLRAWQIQLVESGLNPLSVNRKMASLKSFFSYLLRIDYLRVNPMAKYRAMKAPKKVQLAFSELEMEELRVHLPGKDSVASFRDRLILELLYTSGLRRAELIGLRVSDLRLGQAMVKVLGKRNKERFVPLLPYLVDDFAAYLALRKTEGQTSNLLFISEKSVKLSAIFVYRLVIRYLSKVSEKTKKSPHILRHTFATHLLNKGADMNSVKELLGHSSLASTQVYTQTSLEVLRQAYGKAHPRSKK